MVACTADSPRFYFSADDAIALTIATKGRIICWQNGYYYWFGKDHDLAGFRSFSDWQGCGRNEIYIASEPITQSIYVGVLWSVQAFTPQLTEFEKQSAYRWLGCAATTPIDEGPETPTPETPEPLPPAPVGMEQSCCDEIGAALQTLGEILAGLVKPCADTVIDCKKVTSECLDEIVQAVVDQLQPSIETCDECCDKLRLGVALSVEDARVCANCTCEPIERECSIAGLQPGERCPKCGKEPCCCTEDYTCEPCPPEEADKKFVGWCNTVSGVTIVLDKDKSPPQPVQQWKRVSFGDNESQVLQQAIVACQPTPRPLPVRPPSPPPSASVTYQCSHDTLLSYGSVGGLLGKIDVGVNATEIEQFIRTFDQNLFAQFGQAPGIGPLLSATMAVGLGPIKAAERYGPAIQGILGCESSVFREAFKGLSILGMYQQWTGADLSSFADGLTYVANAACRRKHLDPDKSIASWLSGYIDDELLDRHWAIAGFCPDALTAYKQAAESKPLPLDLITMRFRGLISESEYHKGMRRLGFIHTSDHDNLYEKQKPLPTLSDIIRFMVRDADDEGIVKQFGTDDFFTAKYQEQLRKWSEQQGIDERIAQYAWRSHWTIPPPTQLYEIWRRLRHREEFGGPEALLTDIKAALVQQDILPYWHKALLALSHPPLTRVDVRRAYNIGEFTEQQVYDAYIDIGYSDDNAAVLTKFSSRLRDVDIINHRFLKQWGRGLISGASARRQLLEYGYPADAVDRAMREASQRLEQSPAAKAFTRGEITARLLEQILIADGADPEAVGSILNNLSFVATFREPLLLYQAGTLTFADARQRLAEYGVADERAITQLNAIDAQFESRHANLCERAVRQRVRRGEITPEESEAVYQSVGITAERANRLAAWSRCLLSAQGKAVPTNTLCEWFGRGAINGGQFVDRLKRIGYDDSDSHNLLVDCASKLNLRSQQRAIKDAQEQARLQQKQRAAAEKLARQLERDAAKKERRVKDMQRIRARRQVQVMSAADNIIKKCGCTVADAVAFAVAARDSAVSRYALSIDESLAALLQATEAWDGISFDDLSDIVAANAQLAVDKALAEPITSVSGSASTNGST